jgi:DnaK suppressor protein
MKEIASKSTKKAASPAAHKAVAPGAQLPEQAAVARPPAAAVKAKATPASRAATGPATPAQAAKTARAKAATAPAAAAAPSEPSVWPTKEKARSARSTVPAGREETATRQAVTAAETPARSLATPAATDELADKMKTSVVSKVSEVMTKTTKPNATANAEDRILTEEEIRAMSDADYMNPAQLAFFKARLQQLEKDLLKNAGETTEHLRETVLVPDPADRATIEEEHALELRTRDRERKLLKKVQQSIASIDSGDYGWCEETGEPIGIPRLIARPTATLSLEAQQRRELKQKLYGD